MNLMMKHQGGPPVGQLFRMLIGVFFVGGFLTSVVSLVVPRLKLLFGLDYTQALLVQLAFHSSYLLFAVPITIGIVMAGYIRSIASGLAVMMAGCLAFAAADTARDFVLVLAALLLLSAGITVLQIAANTVATIVGSTADAAARLTLLQGFNALGTVIGPLLAAPLLLAEPASSAMAAGALLPFLLSAVALALLALLFFRHRSLLQRPPATRSDRRVFEQLPVVWRDRRLRAGIAAIFAYVGAEVTIGTLLTNFLMQPGVLGLPAVTAGRLVSIYWAGAMLGRFVGAALLKRIMPASLLAAAASGAVVLNTVAITTSGIVAASALLAVGLCNAVMYPTIYALALPVKPEIAPIGSMLLCMAVVGGAVVPLSTGIAADAFGLNAALALPVLCYAGIVTFARYCRSPVPERTA